MYKRKDITLSILKILDAGIEITGDALDIFLSDYAKSYKKIRQKLYGYQRKKESLENIYKEVQCFYSTLNKLKRDGFIEKNSFWNKTHWILTQKGKSGYKKLLKIKKEKISTSYKKEQSKTLNVIIFDIPECERNKRVWLRLVLLELGFSLLQKSVWIGKVKIPRDFIDDMREKKILNYVHIFEISKRGTINDY